jgi:hypothetical protein
MFVGFSLTDPNFTRIDGWIRDTVGRVRLPAVAITHGTQLSAERNMWKARGIELIALKAEDPLVRFFGAISSDRKRRKRPDTRHGHNVRVHGLYQRVTEIVRDTQKPRDQALKDITAALVEIVVGARTDSDRGVEARREAVTFCWGWSPALVNSKMVNGRLEEEQRFSNKDIYALLTPAQRRELLFLSLEGDNLSLTLAPGEIIDISTDLLGDDKYGLSNDDRAQVYLHRARINRGRGDAAQAKIDIDNGRRIAESKELRARITAEYRELLFLEVTLESWKRNWRVHSTRAPMS